MHRSYGLLLALLLLIPSVQAQTPDGPPKYEFRGAWIATVIGLDWPVRGAPPSSQQIALRQMLDRLHAAGINAVFFQIRSEADAMYASDLEPWSYWLTGEQGRDPEPFWDPLAFAVEEAHRRGMELHAWLNPYRVQRSIGGYALDSLHVSQAHPDWTFTSGSIQVLDPGLPDVRNHIAHVVTDVARRYDIDGIHFDDYFYPYPPNQITDQDDSTFADYPRGFTNQGAWRRDNVNLMVAQVHDSLAAVAPDVAFGISPFGIWKNGVPSGIVGLDAYNVIYADATAWLEAGTIDYLVPQLYWAFGGGQDYGKLAPWWAEQAGAAGRHLYPGHGLYRSDRATFSNTLFAADEVPRQVRYNRAHEDIQGSVFFRAQNITQYASKGFADSLETDLYRYPALTPIMPWRDQTPPGQPEALAYEWTGEDEVTLSWEAPATDGFGPDPRFYAVYRIRSQKEPDYTSALDDARNLLAVTGETQLTDRPGIAEEPYYYVVTAVSANSVEGTPSAAVVVEGRAVAVEAADLPEAFVLEGNYPNPFNPATTIAFTLSHPAPVTAHVYDVLGRRVKTLTADQHYTAGRHTLHWDGRDEAGQAVASGSYLYVVEAAGQRRAALMSLVK